MNLDTAYRHCEQITAREAKNFSYGITLLPAQKRKALSAVYAFARRIDDIGDGTQSREDKLSGLAAADKAVDELFTEQTDPVVFALADATRRMSLPLGAFHELVAGCRADVLGTSYPDFPRLQGYCRDVAGSIGRLALAVFGAPGSAEHDELANALGIALQLTNILRDIREDRANGRIYLPADDLERFGCTFDIDDAGNLLDEEEALLALIEFEAARAEQWYVTGLALLPKLDRRSKACCAAMAGIYHRLLVSIQLRPWQVLHGRLSLPGREKAGVAARALMGAI